MKTNQTKNALHPRNKHQNRYDFAKLMEHCPELAQYVILNPVGEQTIDFANAEAVKTLNKALLAHYYQIKFWIFHLCICVRQFRGELIIFMQWLIF